MHYKATIRYTKIEEGTFIIFMDNEDERIPHYDGTGDPAVWAAEAARKLFHLETTHGHAEFHVKDITVENKD